MRKNILIGFLMVLVLVLSAVNVMSLSTSTFGNVNVSGNLTVGDDLTVTGTSTFNDEVTINSNLTVVGDVIVANVTELAVNGSIYPGLDDTFDLGSTSLTWDTAYINKIVFGNSSAGIIDSPTQSYLRVGDAGTTTHSLTTNDDLLVSGKLEIDGVSYFDGTMYPGGDMVMSSSKLIRTSATSGAVELSDATQTPDTSMLWTGVLSNNWIFAERADSATDFAKPLQDNPTVIIQSADATSTDDYLMMAHDQTDSRLTSGEGDLRLAAAQNIALDGNISVGDDTNYLLFDMYVNGTHAVLESFEDLPIRLNTYTPNGTASVCYVNDTHAWVCEAR